MSHAKGPNGPTQLTRRHALISGFILFHCIAIACYAIPINSLLVTDISRLIGPYMVWTGLVQSWTLFAPEPFSINTRLEAEITYRGGATRIWQFPSPQDFSYAERYLKERQRKWAVDGIRLDMTAPVWPDAARYVARLNNIDPAEPPVTVRLVRYWSDIVLPEAGRARPPEPMHRYVFFSYSVTPQDLQ